MSRISFGLLAVVALLVGCAHTSESASKDTLTANVGNYPAGPKGVNKPRVGVPPFSVQAQGQMQMSDADSLAADQMSTLLDQSGRFDVIERAQLQKLLDEQNLEGIVKPGELAKAGQVRGVDYLLLGKVTNLRVKQEHTKKGFSLAGIGGMFSGAGMNQNDTNIKTECGVDIRMVEPSSGKVVVSNFSEFNRTDSANAMGISILGGTVESEADVQISDDDKGKILRLALDDAVRKSLPKIDKFLKDQPATPSAATPAAAAPGIPAAPVAPLAPAAPTALPAAPAIPAAPAAAPTASKFCPHCGKAVSADAKFCPSCGQKLD
jgi:curli biogenesis system outer membrane secretion channel CsgG